jgi:hypothetical protein
VIVVPIVTIKSMLNSYSLFCARSAAFLRDLRGFNAGEVDRSIPSLSFHPNNFV